MAYKIQYSEDGELFSVVAPNGKTFGGFPVQDSVGLYYLDVPCVIALSDCDADSMTPNTVYALSAQATTTQKGVAGMALDPDYEEFDDEDDDDDDDDEEDSEEEDSEEDGEEEEDDE